MDEKEKALVPVEQKQVEFYDDTITAVRLEDGTVYIPVRPICELIGVTVQGQLERIKRDPILSEMLTVVSVTLTTSGATDTQTVNMSCLPLDYLNGWMFGINANRVKESVRDSLMRYQRECYRVLADAFSRNHPTNSPASIELAQIRDMGLAIARMAEQQMALETRLGTTESRLDRAALVVGDLGKRVRQIEGKLAPHNAITDEQAADISEKVKVLAFSMGGDGQNYQKVFGELHRRFRVTSYKTVRQDQYQAVLSFLDEWLDKTKN